LKTLVIPSEADESLWFIGLRDLSTLVEMTVVGVDIMIWVNGLKF